MSDTTTEELTLFALEEASESLTTQEAARLLGCHPRTVQKKLKAGELAHAPDGGIDGASLTRYRAERRATGNRVPRTQLKHPDTAWAVAQAQVKLLQEEVAWLKAEIKVYKAREAQAREAHRQEREEFKARERDLLSALKARPRANLPRTHQPPTPGTLLDRVYQFLLHADRPKRAWQIQQALNLPTSPGRELERLVDRRLARRLQPGLFQALGSPAPGPMPASTTVPSLLERVYQVVAEAERPLSLVEVTTRLHSTRPVNQELSKLVKLKRLRRISQEKKREGLYCLP
jgi:hypothetical protein